MNHFAHAVRLPRDGTALVTIDTQEKLAAAMDGDVAERAIANTRILLSAAQILSVPRVVTEQYPKGLGTTVPALRDVLSEGVMPIEKVEFSCVRAPGFMDRLRDLGVRQVVLAGMEAHVCVLLTAVDLLQSGIGVWVAEDAVCSRRKEHWLSALRVMECAGAVVVPAESILFTLLGKAGTPEFKEVSKLIK